MPLSRDIAVIGLGTFGAAVAKELSRMGDRVVGIDQDPAIVKSLDGEIDVVMEADATDSRVLQQAGLDNFDAVIIAIGDNMQASLLTTLGLMNAGQTEVYVKAQTPEHARILNAIGVRNLLEPEQSFALHLSQLLHNPNMVDFLNLGNGNYIASINAPSANKCKRVSDLGLSAYNLDCIAIDIGERIVTRDLDTHELSISDKLILAGKRSDLRRFALSG